MGFNACLESFMADLQQIKSVIWAGDLNVAHKEIDIARPKTNEKSAGYTPEERDNFSAILSVLGFVDTYRHFHPEDQKYSYYSYRFNCKQKNIGWRLDYFLVDEKFLKSCVISSDILDNEYGPSDHVPIILTIKDEVNDDKSVDPDQ